MLLTNLGRENTLTIGDTKWMIMRLLLSMQRNTAKIVTLACWVLVVTTAGVSGILLWCTDVCVVL